MTKTLMPYPLLDPLNVLRHHEASDCLSLPDSALGDGTLWRWAVSATTLAPKQPWVWKQRANYAQLCVLLGAEEQERYWDDALVCVSGLEALGELELAEVTLVDTIAHARSLRHAFSGWMKRHDLARRIEKLQWTRLEMGDDGLPLGWGYLDSEHLRARYVGRSTEVPLEEVT